MLRILILSQFFLLIALVPGFASDRSSKILEGIQIKYGHLPGLTIDYSREVTTRSMALLGSQIKKELATGKMYFKPPHFLRLEQENPRPETVITDGEALWWYIPEKNQVHRYSAKDFGKELELHDSSFMG